MDCQIVIFGGKGYIGKFLISKLKDDNIYDKILVIERNQFKDALEQAIDTPFIIINLAGRSPRKVKTNHELEYMEGNVKEPLDLLFRYSKDKNCKGIIYVNTILPEYKISTKISNSWSVENAYHKSRLIQDLLHDLVDAPFPIYSLRISNVYGGVEDDWSVPSKLKKALANELELTFHDSTVKRDYIHIDDVSNLIINGINDILNVGQTGLSIFEVGSGKSLSIDEILSQLNLSRLSIISPNIVVRDVKVDIRPLTSKFSWKPRIDLIQWISK